MSDRSNAESDGRRLVSLAAERTLIAWIRTALALMALGFIIDRFSLFLRRTGSESAVRALPEVIPLWASPTIVGFGALFALVAAVRYSLFYRQFRRGGDPAGGYGVVVATLFAAVVGLGGLLLAIFMATSLE